ISMLPLLVNSRLQPSQTRRTALGFFSFASLTFICRLFGPSKKIKHRIYNHLPPLWFFIKTQVPYLQSLAASFSKTWGVGAYAKSSLCNQQLPDSFFSASRIFPEFLLFWGPPGNGPHRVRSPQKECEEAQREHRVAQAGAEVLPKSRVGPRVIRREEQRYHEDQSAEASWPHQHSQDQRNPNRQLAVRHQERDRRRMHQHKMPQHRFHEGICPS